MDRLSKNESLLIWELVVGPDDAWYEHWDYSWWCDVDEIDIEE